MNRHESVTKLNTDTIMVKEKKGLFVSVCLILNATHSTSWVQLGLIWDYIPVQPYLRSNKTIKKDPKTQKCWNNQWES